MCVDDHSNPLCSLLSYMHVINSCVHTSVYCSIAVACGMWQYVRVYVPELTCALLIALRQSLFKQLCISALLCFGVIAFEHILHIFPNKVLPFVVCLPVVCLSLSSPLLSSSSLSSFFFFFLLLLSLLWVLMLLFLLCFFLFFHRPSER